METLISSIRGYLRFRPWTHLSKSSLDNTHGNEASKIPYDSSAKSNHKMPDAAVILTSIHGRRLNDIERQQIAAEGIYVQTKVSSHGNERHPSGN